MGGQERLAAPSIPPHPVPSFPQSLPSPSPSRPPPHSPRPVSRGLLGALATPDPSDDPCPAPALLPVRRPLPSVSPWSGFSPCRLRSAPPRLQEETSCSRAKSSRPGNSREITRGVARLPAKVWGRKEGEGVLAGHREAELCETDTRGTHCSKKPEGERVR